MTWQKRLQRTELEATTESGAEIGYEKHDAVALAHIRRFTVLIRPSYFEKVAPWQ